MTRIDIQNFGDSFYDQYNDELADAINGPEFRALGLDVNPDPDMSRWGSRPEAPIVEKYAHTTVGLPVADMKRLQEYVGVTIGTAGSEESFWSGVHPENVDQMAAVLAGRAEPIQRLADIYNGGIPAPYVVFGSDGSLRAAQEGRHRTLAAEQAGLAEIPVHVYYNHTREGADGPLAGEGTLRDVFRDVMTGGNETIFDEVDGA